MIQNIDATQLKELLTNPDVQLVDVRDWSEHDDFNIGGTVMPLSQFTKQYQTLDASKPIALYCHLGQRSLMAAQFLVQKGYAPVYNLSGGIMSWIKTFGYQPKV